MDFHLPKQPRRCLTVVVLWSAWLFAVQISCGQDNHDLDLFGAGDIAFTEPVEFIKVACGDTGIVGKVHVVRGARVKRSDLLLELDMSVLEASRQLAAAKARSSAKLNAAQVEFDQKKKRYEKLVQLLRENAGSPEEVDRAKADMQVANENIVGLREEKAQHQLELSTIETRIEGRRVRSPIEGDVVDVRRKQGEFVSHNDPHVATVVRLDQLRVVFHLPTSNARSLRQGKLVNVLLMESNQVAEATVEYVAPITSAESGRVRVDALIENADGRFRSGVPCQLMERSARHSQLEKLNR